MQKAVHDCALKTVKMMKRQCDTMIHVKTKVCVHSFGLQSNCDELHDGFNSERNERT